MLPMKSEADYLQTGLVQIANLLASYRPQFHKGRKQHESTDTKIHHQHKTNLDFLFRNYSCHREKNGYYTTDS